MSKTARTLLGRVVAAAAVLSMVAAACGSDSSEPVTEPASQPAQQQETQTTSPPEEAGQPETPADESVPADDAPAGAADDAAEEAPATTAAPAETGTTTDEPPATTVPARIVRIGVAFPDLEAFAVLNPEFGIGDPEAQALAVVDQWVREGLLPEGIGVELVFGKYNIISDSAKLGVCTAFAQDSDVFAAVSSVSFTVGAECLATRFQIPVIDADGAPPSLYQRGAPWFFTLRADHAKHLRSYAQWAIDNGLFNNRVGMYYETRLDEGVEAMRELVAAAGLEITSETATSGEGVGSPEDPIAVQRFIVDGVEVVLPLVGGSSLAGVLGFSESQGFRPVYLSTDYGEQTADVQAKTLPAEQFDGAMAVTMKRAGEIAAGMVNEEAEACLIQLRAVLRHRHRAAGPRVGGVRQHPEDLRPALSRAGRPARRGGRPHQGELRGRARDFGRLHAGGRRPRLLRPRRPLPGGPLPGDPVGRRLPVLGSGVGLHPHGCSRRLGRARQPSL